MRIFYSVYLELLCWLNILSALYTSTSFAHNGQEVGIRPKYSTWEVKTTEFSPWYLLLKEPVLLAGVCHCCHIQAGVVEGIAVVESIGYKGLPVVKYFYSLAAADHAQHQQQQVVHHPAH